MNGHRNANFHPDCPLAWDETMHCDCVLRHWIDSLRAKLEIAREALIQIHGKTFAQDMKPLAREALAKLDGKET